MKRLSKAQLEALRLLANEEAHLVVIDTHYREAYIETTEGKNPVHPNTAYSLHRRGLVSQVEKTEKHAWFEHPYRITEAGRKALEET